LALFRIMNYLHSLPSIEKKFNSGRLFLSNHITNEAIEKAI
jgi:hypothetical protein